MMPRVIQPGGGGGKMYVRYTARRKRGLVAALKSIQAEVMTLGELCVTTPPPRRKINPKSPKKNKGATPSPGRFSPNPVVQRLIVMFYAIETGRIVRFRPPGRKMKTILPPPQQILPIFPLERRATVPSSVHPSLHPGAHWFIFMFLRLGTGRSNQICPPGGNLKMP
jgi:hypothetical protein